MNKPRSLGLRALIATPLVAVGFSAIPIAVAVAPDSLSGPVAYATAIAFFSLPLAGVGVIFARPALFGAVGVAIGVLVVYFRL